MTGKQFFKHWFDQHERQLHEEAKLAGLLQHGTMIGNAREFFIRRVLRSFLPPGVTIGTGRVIGAGHEPSRQIDVVIYDSRFPLLAMPDGQALFLIEGVIAAIEVKSNLDEKRLTEALQNCLSVVQIAPCLVTSDVDAKLAALEASLGNKQRAREELSWSVQPRTYIFGFRGSDRPKTLNKRIKKWLQDHCEQGASQRLLLPSVVVSGGSIALRQNDPIQIEGGEYFDASGKPTSGEHLPKLMTTWASKKRFGWLAIHILHQIEQRSLLDILTTGIRRGISQYYPFKEYYDEHGADEEKIVMVLEPPRSPVSSNGATGSA